MDDDTADVTAEPAAPIEDAPTEIEKVEAPPFVEDDPVDTEPVTDADGEPVPQPEEPEAAPPLPEIEDVVAALKPSDPVVVAQWDQAAVNAQQAVVVAQTTLDQTKLLAARDDSPVDGKSVVAAEQALELAERRLAIVEKAQGRKVGEVLKVTLATVNENIQAAQGQIAQWKQTRATTQDYLDNPAAHGFTTVSGEPLIPSKLSADVARFDVAIEKARDRIRALKEQRDALAEEGK